MFLQVISCSFHNNAGGNLFTFCRSTCKYFVLKVSLLSCETVQFTKNEFSIWNIDPKNLLNVCWPRKKAFERTASSHAVSAKGY